MTPQPAPSGSPTASSSPVASYHRTLSTDAPVPAVALPAPTTPPSPPAGSSVCVLPEPTSRPPLLHGHDVVTDSVQPSPSPLMCLKARQSSHKTETGGAPYLLQPLENTGCSLHSEGSWSKHSPPLPDLNIGQSVFELGRAIPYLNIGESLYAGEI